jgi:hypothetical protein
MATNSVQYENYLDAIALGAGFNNQANDLGKLYIARFDVQTAASSAGEIINLCVLPAGAKYLCTVLAFEGTSSLTLDIGDADDPDRLVNDASLGSDNPTSASLWTGIYTRVDSTAFGTAGPGSNTSTAIALGIGYKYTANTAIYGTTAGATATAGEVIRGGIIYSLN